MEQRLHASLARQRFQLFLLGAFAALSLLLSAIGIYGVVSYSVGHRRHEIGLRMALGASHRDVLSLVARQGILLSLLGIALGVGLAVGLTRYLASLLYGVRPTDPVTFAAVSPLLISLALIATYIPARRAMKADPMVVLRYE